MSGSEVEMFDESGGEDQNAESEEEILRLRALIETVRPCPALYAKSKKEYCGKNFSKDLAWETVGAAQVPSLSGKEAKDLFYKLRQKFGKEWRKFQTHQKGKSGQGNAGPFISTWALYEDLKFLGDHITPRKTRSTYKSNTTLKCKKSLLSSGSPSPSSSSDYSALWNADIGILTGSVAASIEQSEETSTSDCTVEPTPTDQVLKAMEEAAKGKKRVPAPDQFASKRQKNDKEFMDSMIAQGNALTKVAAAFGKALEKETGSFTCTFCSRVSNPWSN